MVQILSCLEGVLLQLLPLNHVQDCVRCSHGHRVASVGAEKFHVTLAIAFSDLFSANNGSDRESVSHRLSDRDDVRHNVVVLKRPKILSEPPKSCLHFIPYAHYIAVSQDFVDSLIEVFGRDDLATTTLHVFTYECSRIFIDNTLHVLGIVCDWSY